MHQAAVLRPQGALEALPDAGTSDRNLNMARILIWPEDLAVAMQNNLHHLAFLRNAKKWMAPLKYDLKSEIDFNKLPFEPYHIHFGSAVWDI